MLARLHIAGCIVSALLAAGAAAAAVYPPLSVELTPDRPLFIFEMSGFDVIDPVAYGDSVIRAWARLADNLKPYSAVQVSMEGPDLEARHTRFRALLDELAEVDIPVVIRVADVDPASAYPLDKTEELLSAYTFIKGIQAVGLSFSEYQRFGADGGMAPPPAVGWLAAVLDVAARYGRFAVIELDGLNWLRIMSNPACKPLYDRMRELRAYAVPIAMQRDSHALTQQSAVMGLWLEGVADQWGVAPSSDWYKTAGCLGPGVFGRGPHAAMPPALYRAMILTGAMTGACAYSFRPGADLWFGEQRQQWEQAIATTLEEVVANGFIARKDFVQNKAKAAYQMTWARSPREFHLNLRDLDPVFDEGLLIRGAYGIDDPGQVPELIPNTGRHYWVPILSPYAPREVIESFAYVATPGIVPSADAWTELLDRYYRPDGMGSAFICRVGRGVFVLHTRENLYQTQNYRVPETPAPVRGIKTQRTEQGVEIAWPFREGDVAYRVYRRILPDGPFEVIASEIDQRAWLDAAAPADQPLAYTVTALTNEMAAAEGTLNFGDYLVFSVVESQPGEEAPITPLLGYGKGRPIETPEDTRPPAQTWWPSFDGLDESRRATARTVADRLTALFDAFCRKDLDSVMDVYSTNYEDGQGWRFQYARRAYQWFFERYGACRTQRQIRMWDFSEYEASGRVAVTLYCRFSGTAITDPTGRFANMTAYFPRTETGEVVLRLAEEDGAWRIVRSDPALPNFRDILTFSAGPEDALSPGPDTFFTP